MMKLAGEEVLSKLSTNPACVPAVKVTLASAITSASPVETEEKREERVRGLRDTSSTLAYLFAV